MNRTDLSNDTIICHRCNEKKAGMPFDTYCRECIMLFEVEKIQGFKDLLRNGVLNDRLDKFEYGLEPEKIYVFVQDYVKEKSIQLLNELLQRPDLLLDAVQNEQTNHDAESLIDDALRFTNYSQEN